MSWVEDMKADAAQIAFPGLARLDDFVEFSVSSDPGYHYSSYTYEDPHMEISVNIPERKLYWSVSGNDSVAEFMDKLLELGAKRREYGR